MQRIYESIISKNYSIPSDKKYHKVLALLNKYVYMQTNVAMAASLFCACLIFIAMYNYKGSNFNLWLWTGFYIAVTLFRLTFCYLYQHDRYPEKRLSTWRNLYTVGSFLGGVSWGLASILILPDVDATRQTFVILMLAGVTAGAVPLSAAIPSAAITFLAFSICPIIVFYSLSKNGYYLLFNMALIVYLAYTVALTIKAHRLIKNSIIYQFENDTLLKHLETTNKKLELAATHDPLTRVGNRRLFVRNLSEAIEYSRVNKKMFALFFIDLDKFKLANDLYGHHAGDHILITVIERLAKYFRKTDVIARLGGDELAIIVKDARNKQELEIIATKICELISMPSTLNDIILSTTASIGISVYPYDGEDGDALLRCADKCMYLAKQRGGNQYYFSQEVKEYAL